MPNMTLTKSERMALVQMLDTAPDLDRWRLRAHRVEEPEPGSDLAVDDKIFPPMAISQLARISLVLSGEHLRLGLDAIRAGQLSPLPTSPCCGGRWSAHPKRCGSSALKTAVAAASGRGTPNAPPTTGHRHLSGSSIETYRMQECR